MVRRALRFVGFALGLSLIVVLWTAGSIWFFNPDPGKTADAAMVLGASTWNGKPSPVYRERIQHGINLYHQDRVGTLLFSGGTGIGEPRSLAEAGRDMAMAQGVPAKDILLEPWSRNTRQNLHWSRQVLETNQVETVLIVSDPLHLKRALAIAGHAGLDASPSATPTSMFRSRGARWKQLKGESKWLIGYRLIGRWQDVGAVPAS